MNNFLFGNGLTFPDNPMSVRVFLSGYLPREIKLDPSSGVSSSIDAKAAVSFRGFDIGLYPLSDDDWISGKSGLKALQYMAMGLPAVASNIGNNINIIQHMHNGILVKTKEEWIYNLKLLISDCALRKKLGYNARKTIENHYSLDKNSSKYLEILNN